MNIPEYDFYGEDYEEQLENRIEEIKNNYHNIPVTLTGNPFVDAGIYAVSNFKDKDINSITVGDVLRVIINIDGNNSNGRAFAHRNARTKATSKVLFNNPLIQPAYGSSRYKGYKNAPSKAEPSKLQERMYRSYLIEFLRSYCIDQTSDTKNWDRCMICGLKTDFDFNELETVLKALASQEPIEKKDDFGSGPTRTWIPLLGTTSAIQNMPGFAEPNIVCGKCLVLAQFIPQLVDLQNRLLTLYQSNNHNLVKEFYKINFKNFTERHQSTPNDEKLEIIGSDSSDYYINNLLEIIAKFTSDFGKSSLTLWRFDNYGTDPDLAYIQLPNQTLSFLHTVIVNEDEGSIIKNFIRIEEENNFTSRLRLFNSIVARNDYLLFYPNTDIEIEFRVPQNIFEIYQLSIRDWHPDVLQICRSISKLIKENISDQRNEELLRILKERNYSQLRDFVIPHLLNYLDLGKISIENILKLTEGRSEIVRNRNPWKLFFYYLHPNLTIEEIDYQMETHPVNFESERMDYLAILQFIAISTKERNMTRSSFDFEKYIDMLSRMSFNDFRNNYIQTSFDNPFLTWQKFELLQHHFYKYEILFYFRLFSIKKMKTLKTDFPSITLDTLIEECGINKTLAQVLINYLENRIEDIGPSRVFSELLNDLKYSNYSARQFYNLLLKKLGEEEEVEIEFDEYHFFTYELEYSSKFPPISGNKTKPTFSWKRLRDKLRLFISQYRIIRKPNSLEQQLEEEIK